MDPKNGGAVTIEVLRRGRREEVVQAVLQTAYMAYGFGSTLAAAVVTRDAAADAMRTSPISMRVSPTGIPNADVRVDPTTVPC